MVLHELARSRSNARLLQRAATFLQDQTKRNEVLVLAPTRAAAHELALRASDAGCQGVHALTLSQLAANLAAQSMGRLLLAPVSRLGMEALAARIVDAALHAGRLNYFSAVSQMPGFARAAARTITELRLHDIQPQALAETGRPGGDLAYLLDQYERELQERSLADLPLLLRLAVDEAASGEHRFIGLPAVLLGLAIESPRHQRLIQELAARSPAVLATAIADDERSVASLESILGVAARDLELEPETTTLGRVRAWLFSSSTPPSAPPDPALLFSAPGESFECVEIARRIHSLARAGTPFDRVAILLRNVDQYQPLVEEALRRAAVPAYVSRGAARPDPAGRAFLALLACANESCSASRFAEYLSLGQVPPLDETGAPKRLPPAWAPPADEILASFAAVPPGAGPVLGQDTEGGTLAVPIGWEKLLVDAAVIGGRDRWARRLKGLRAELQTQLRDLDREDESHRSHIGRRVEQLENLEHFALPLIDALNALPQASRWGDWLEHLMALAPMALRRPESVLAVLGELEPMREVGPISLDEVYDVLSERLGFLRIEPQAGRFGRVFVGSIEEARGRSFDVVFLPGLAEGLFPRRSLEDPLLLDEYRKKLGAGLDTQDRRVADERMLLRSAAAAATQAIVVSYPRMDVVQARARVPSFYALEVVRAAEGRLPSVRELRERAARSAPARLDWPSPADPRTAIDDAEYDLASLQSALKLRGAAAKGSARYLVESNQSLADSLRTRGRRWRNLWSPADGVVDPDEPTLDALRRHRLTRRSYSPSSLQQFAACPYRFLLHAVFQFRPRESAAPLQHMDPLTRGAIFHAVQFALFRELEDAKMLPVTQTNLAGTLNVCDQVLDRVAARFEDDLAPAIPRVWKSEIEGLRTDLRGWIQQVAANDAGWKPVHFEFGFGLPTDPNRDTASTPEEAVILGGVRVRGSIDLVERNAARGVLRVTDHKTGKAPQARPHHVGGGATLQPLLYALAAEGLLQEPVESGGLFFCTQRGDFARVDISTADEARERLKHVLAIIERSIEEGFLPAAPQTGACSLCDYVAVCGPYEEQRVRRKQPGRLDSLIELRHQP